MVDDQEGINVKGEENKEKEKTKEMYRWSERCFKSSGPEHTGGIKASKE